MVNARGDNVALPDRPSSSRCNGCLGAYVAWIPRDMPSASDTAIRGTQVTGVGTE
jgi:hypothetical protein